MSTSAAAEQAQAAALPQPHDAVLVTGATGTVGRHVVAELLRRHPRHRHARRRHPAQPPRTSTDTHSCTGPQTPSWTYAARALTTATRRTVRYQDVPARRYRTELLQAGQPPDLVRVQLLIHLLMRTGLAGTVTQDLPRTLHRPATTFAQYARDNLALWQRPGADPTRAGARHHPENDPRDEEPT